MSGHIAATHLIIYVNHLHFALLLTEWIVNQHYMKLRPYGPMA